MKIVVISSIIILSVFFQTNAQKLEPVLKLDTSKNYELYVMDFRIDDTIICIKTPRNESDTEICIRQYSKIELYKEFSRVYVSKKTGFRMAVYNLTNFVVNDQKTIKKIANEWTGVSCNSGFCGCPSDYLVFLLEDGKWVETFGIVHGKFIISQGEIVGITVRPFDNMDRSNKFFTAKISFTSLEQSESFIKDVRKLEGIYVVGYNWLNYDGSFDLKFNNGGDMKIIEKLKYIIKAKYPQENFDIDLCECWTNKYLIVRISCNKSLADAFASYKIYKKWEPFSMQSTEIFFKDLTLIQGLIDKYIND